jgi:GTP-binding protein EngB required for normal cell division
MMPGRREVDRLLRRVDALDRFVTAASGHLTAESLAPARTIVERVGKRLAVSREHTVVALAGATGSGKSSLFNAIAGEKFSTTGVRRPTTGTAHACVWGDGDPASLLDWLDIPAGQRFTTAGSSTLDGLVLVDLPDFDSVRAEHRREADRLLALADLVIWVTDPQKYADRVIHEQYLRTFQRHAATTVVVLNQADLLSPDDLRRCLTDLTRLLTADGFHNVPVFGVSATAPAPGIGKLRDVLARAVTERKAALERLSVEVGAAVATSRALVGPAAKNATDSPALTDALGHSAGVPAICDAAASAYRFRARGSMGWPVVRWVRRIRTDPLGRLRLGRAEAGASSLPAPGAAVQAVADLAIRDLIDRASTGLPAPWPTAVRDAARSHRDTLADALDVAVMTTDIGMSRKPRWWRLIGSLQWLLTIAALAGGVWILLRIVLIALGLARLQTPGTDVSGVGQVPWATIALIGGALVGLLLALLVRPIVALGARRARRRTRSRLTRAVDGVAEQKILDPVRGVLRDYTEARTALTDAG